MLVSIAQASRRNHLDGRSQKVSQLVLDAQKVEHRAAVVEVDQQVDVAGRLMVTARHRPENPDVPGAVAFGDGNDVVAALPQEPSEPSGIFACCRDCLDAELMACCSQEACQRLERRLNLSRLDALDH